VGKYKKIFIQRFKEEGGLRDLPSNALDIVVLPKVGDLKTKVSIEVRKPEIEGTKEGEVRSFRTTSAITVENIIMALAEALGLLNAEKGVLDESNVDKELKHLIDKIRISYIEANRKYKELKG